MNNKNNIIKKLTKYFFIILYLLFLFLSLTLFYGCSSKMVDYTYLVDSFYKEPDVSIFKDSLGENSIKLLSKRDFKVLQLSDIHIGNGPLSLKKDKKAIEAVINLIEYSKPDLIILSGDFVFPSSFITGSNDNLTALKVLANVIEKYKTPWTLCFGNHDAESSAKYSKSELCDYLLSNNLQYCLFNNNSFNVDGMGNHIINIYNSDNSFNSTIFLFDNGMYCGESQLSGYQEISDSQVSWYENKIKQLSSHFKSDINSYVYYHVPGKEYELAWQEYKNGNVGGNIKYFFGDANEKNEKISCPSELGKFFETAVILKSTKAIFCGHDHLNDFSIEYKGIRLTYSKSIDYTAYVFQGIANKTEQRGGTLLILKNNFLSSNSTFDIQHIKLTDIC